MTTDNDLDLVGAESAPPVTPGKSGFLGRQERRALKAQILGISPIKASERELDAKLAAEGKLGDYTTAYIAATGASKMNRRDRASFSLPDSLPAAVTQVASRLRTRRGRKAAAGAAATPDAGVEALDTATPPAEAVATPQEATDLDPLGDAQVGGSDLAV